MRYAILPVLLVAALSCASRKVDPGLVGTWELNVPNAEGVARWVWEIHADGTYAFHAEGPGNTPSHDGVFQARSGRYTLRSTTMAWADTGTYQLLQANTLSATGRLGTASWARVQPVAPPPASPDSPPAAPPGAEGVYPANRIFDYLAHHPFDERILEAPLTAARTVTVEPDAQEKRDGIIGIARTEVHGSSSPATITFVVFRDRSVAEAAHDAYAVFDANSFRAKPGEFISSHAYTYRERGEARCLSRLMVDATATATVTCYLLVQYPTQEPVLIESTVTEQVRPGIHEATAASVTRANDLLFAGLKEWTLIYPEIGDGTPR